MRRQDMIPGADGPMFELRTWKQGQGLYETRYPSQINFHETMSYPETLPESEQRLSHRCCSQHTANMHTNGTEICEMTLVQKKATYVCIY